MKYMVCRKDAVNYAHHRHNTNTINSSCFPIIVEINESEFGDVPRSYEEWYEFVIRKAFDSISHGYRGKHDYIVIPMNGAKLVSFKPRPVYDISITNYG